MTAHSLHPVSYTTWLYLTVLIRILLSVLMRIDIGTQLRSVLLAMHSYILSILRSTLISFPKRTRAISIFISVLILYSSGIQSWFSLVGDPRKINVLIWCLSAQTTRKKEATPRATHHNNPTQTTSSWKIRYRCINGERKEVGSPLLSYISSTHKPQFRIALTPPCRKTSFRSNKHCKGKCINATTSTRFHRNP